MAKLKAPFALDRSLNTTEQTSRNIADVLAEELSAIITALGGLNFINYEVVEELPTTGISTTTIYLVPSDDPQSGNTYDEYINLNGTVSGWEKIGSTAIDLSGYYTSAETDALLDEKVDKDSFDEQTATDEFTTINGGLLSECKVALSPIQDLHGYDHPYVGGAGKNKVPLTLNNLKAINTNGTWSGNDYEYRGVTYSVLADDADNVLGIKANGQATQNSLFVLWVVPIFTSTCILSGCPANGSVNTYHLQYSNYVNYTYEQIGTDVSVTQFDAETYPNAKMQIIVSANYTANDLIFTPMLRASGTSADFEPYSNICPITGHTESKVQNIGKNLLYIKNKAYANRTGNLIDATGAVCTDLIPCVPNETFTAYKSSILSAESYSMVARRFDENGNYIGNIAVMSYDEIGYKTITIPSDAYFIGVVQYGVLDSNDNYLADIMFARGVHDTYVPYNGYQITVNLGGTYYSGVLDVVSGVFPPDTAGVDLGTLTWTYNGTRFASYISDITLENTRLKGICSHYPVFDGSVNDAPDKSLIFNNSNNTIYIKDSAYTDASAFTTAMSGVQVVYKLANPTPIQLIPTPVKANVGENHLSAPLEGQEITESKYRELFTWDEVEAYVKTHSGSVMNYSTEEQVVGTWIDGKPLYQKTWDFGQDVTVGAWTSVMSVADVNIDVLVNSISVQNNKTVSMIEYWVDGTTLKGNSLRQNTAVDYVRYLTLQYTKTTD